MFKAIKKEGGATCDCNTQEAAKLSTYWDERFQGRAADPGELDPDMVELVDLLYDYKQAERAGTHAGSTAPASEWRIRLPYLAAAAVLVFMLLGIGSTLSSPRSPLSGAADPDWIPVLSDDLLGNDLLSSSAQVDYDATPPAGGTTGGGK